MTRSDAVYIYVRLEAIAYELQRTRGILDMGVGMLRAVGHGAHLGIGLQTQHLDREKLIKKEFYNAVNRERSAFNRAYRVYGRNNILTSDAEIILRFVKYLIHDGGANAPADPGLANMKRVNSNVLQIQNKALMMNLPEEGWKPSEREIKKLELSYFEGR